MKRGKMVHSGKSVEEALAPIIFGLEELVRGKPKEEKHGEPCKICGRDWLPLNKDEICHVCTEELKK